jgi:polysaccharide biosynthesis protein PslH
MKVLFITTTFPLPPHAGAKVALLETVGSLENLCELHLLVPSPAAGPNAQRELQERLPNTRIHYYEARDPQPSRSEKYSAASLALLTGKSYQAGIWTDKNLRQSVLNLWREHAFDIVHCEWLYPAIALEGLNLPIVVRTLDLHFAIMRDGLDEFLVGRSLRKSLWRIEVERFRRLETGILNKALACIAVSPEDEAVLRREGVSNVVMIPPPMALPPQTPSTRPDEEKCNALFLCMLHAMVNRESSFLFTDEILPLVSEQARAGVNIVFAGGQPDQGARDRAAECGIEMHAPLSDEEARILYQDADIFLSPIKTGTGIKTKTLEAMANGKPIIGFPNSFRGVPAEDGKHAMIVESNEDFARGFEKLIADTHLRKQMGAAAREFIGEVFNPESLGQRLIDAYQKALDNSR